MDRNSCLSADPADHPAMPGGTLEVIPGHNHGGSGREIPKLDGVGPHPHLTTSRCQRHTPGNALACPIPIKIPHGSPNSPVGGDGHCAVMNVATVRSLGARHINGEATDITRTDLGIRGSGETHQETNEEITKSKPL